MQRACVLVNYEVVLSGPHLPEEDVRMPGVGIFDVVDGKVRERKMRREQSELMTRTRAPQLTKGTIVIDLSPTKNTGPDLNCVVS